MFALIDANSFFASCEQVYRSDLRGKPVVVLSNNDGCVIARNVEAKQLGIPMGVNRPKIIGGRMDWIRRLCLIRLFGDSTPLQILLAECSRWNSAVGAG